MEQETAPKPRLNVLTRADRTKRIFDRLREGWAYDEIARAESLSAERVRQIVSEVLGSRVVDRGQDHALLQLSRIAPALKLTAQAVKRGDMRAIGPLLKVLDRLDRYQTTMIAKYHYGDEERKKLFDKINQVARNLGYDKELEAAEGKEGAIAGSDAAERRESENISPSAPS